MAKDTGMEYLTEIDGLLTPMSDLNGVINDTDGNLALKKLKDVMKQVCTSVA